MARYIPAVLALGLAVSGPLSGTAWGLDIPREVNFQGKLLDPATNNPKNGPTDFTFRICNHPTNACDCPADAACLWEEAQAEVNVANGVFSVRLGSITAIPTEALAGATAYLSVTVSGDSEMLPRQKLAASPYAVTAAQLVFAGDVRINAGPAYSTFTSLGNLMLPYGLSAGTGSFSGGLTASSGSFTATGGSQYSLETSSGARLNAGTLRLEAGSSGLNASGTGIVASTGLFNATGANQFSVTSSSGLDVLAGTLKLEPESRGLNASGTGIVASTGLFNATGATQYSLATSSGIDVLGGTLRAEGSGGVHATYGVVAATFTGDGSALTGTAALVAQSSGSAQVTLTAGTERAIMYSTITLTSADKAILAIGFANVGSIATAGTATLRLRRSTSPTFCTTLSQLIDTVDMVIDNTATYAVPVVLVTYNSPGAAGTYIYCGTLTGTAAYTYRAKSLALLEVAPASTSGQNP